VRDDYIRDEERDKSRATHTKDGFYHDGRFSMLPDVINHYDSCFSLELSDRDKSDVIEFLESLPQPRKTVTSDSGSSLP